MSRNWTMIEVALPPEGVEVEVMQIRGEVSNVTRKGRLYFMPDGDMYVYYTPAYWRLLQNEKAT